MPEVHSGLCCVTVFLTRPSRGRMCWGGPVVSPVAQRRCTSPWEVAQAQGPALLSIGVSG